MRFEVIYGGQVDVVHHVVLYWCELSDLTNGGYTFGGPPIVGGGLCSKGILYAWAIGECIFHFERQFQALTFAHNRWKRKFTPSRRS